MDASDLKNRFETILAGIKFDKITDTEAIIKIVYQLMQYAHSSCNFLKEEDLLKSIDAQRKDILYKTLYTTGMNVEGLGGGILYYLAQMTIQLERICSSKQQKLQEYHDKIAELESVIANNASIDESLENAQRTYTERNEQVDIITEKQKEIKRLTARLEQVDTLIKDSLDIDGNAVDDKVRTLNETAIELQARWQAMIDELCSTNSINDEQLEKICRLKNELMLVNSLDANALIGVIDVLKVEGKLNVPNEKENADNINRLKLQVSQARNDLTELEKTVTQIVKIIQIKNDYKKI